MAESESKSELRISSPNMIDKMRANPWMVSTVLLLIALVAVSLFSAGGKLTGNVVSEKTAAENLVSFINAQGQGNASVVSTAEENGLYKITVKYNNQDIPVYVTHDSKFFTVNLAPLSTTDATAASAGASQTQAEVPKSNKPKAEAFVFAYCPYGLQFEKALVPVYNLLKSKADISVVYIGAMHGQFEQTESYRQLCIQKNYGTDKLFAYIDKFAANTAIGACNGNEQCSTPLVEGIMSSLGIDKDKINSCMASDAKALYDADVAKAQSLGISGSPGFVINGVESQVNRTPAAIQTAICSAFNNAPSECSQTLSSAATSAGFGGSAGSSTGASCG